MPREEMMEKFVISGVTHKMNQAKVTIRDIPDRPGIAASLFGRLAENKISVDMIVQSTGKDGIASISFTIEKDDLKKTLGICESMKSEMGGTQVDSKDDIAVVSAVGVGMISSYGVAARMFRVLAEHGVNIEMIATSEIGISCVIDTKYIELAIKIIHKEFIE